MANPNFDMNSFNAAYKTALADHIAEHKKFGINVGDVTGEFCKDWPKVMAFLNMAIGWLGWYNPAIATTARAAITAINQVAVPVVCGVAAPVPATPVFHTNEH